MGVILGIDLGTQSLKAMLLDTHSGESICAGAAYELKIPQADHAQEEPKDWIDALCSALHRLRAEKPLWFSAVCAVGFSGQMHGLVAVDSEGKPLCPAIVWVDQRSKQQVAQIESVFSADELARTMHNRVFTGFGLPSLLWLKQECPEIYAQTARICSPKDYLRAFLTGGLPETDVTDASSMTGFDFSARDWNRPLFDRLGLDPRKLPHCHESTELAGCVCRKAAEQTGLAEGIPVVFGSGDLPAVLLGCGAYREGYAVANIGTGGNYSCYSADDRYDKGLRMQEFCNAIHRSYALCGATLSGGLSVSWIKNKVLGIADYDELNEMVRSVPEGSEGLIFLPYLGGERTPHMDYHATGLFFGLRHLHERPHFCRAVMEGVTFSLKDAQRVLEESGASNHTVIAAGGGARSPIWLQMQADIFEKEILVTTVEEQACLGACLVAGLGIGLLPSAESACERFVSYQSQRYIPNEVNFPVYRRRYETYRALYPRLKDLMAENR